MMLLDVSWTKKSHVEAKNLTTEYSWIIGKHLFVTMQRQYIPVHLINEKELDI